MIYLDSCIVVYAQEHPGELGDAARRRIASAAESDFAISPLVELECLVGPIRTGDAPLIEAYESLFDQLTSLPLDRAVHRRAAQLRAQTPSLRTVDALHLACAEGGGCEQLWTNDARLARVGAGIAVDILAR